MKYELNASEVKAIRKAAKDCSLYQKEWTETVFDEDGSFAERTVENYCVLRETTCDIFSRHYARNTEERRNGCKYFEESVLPADPALKIIWFGGHTQEGSLKPCIVCGKMFAAMRNAQCCSGACQAERLRTRKKENKRKNRAEKREAREQAPSTPGNGA